VTNVNVMKNRKTKYATEGDSHVSQKETDAGMVSEPYMQYGFVVNTSISRAIRLMGMDTPKDLNVINSDKDFIGLIRMGIPRQAMTYLMDVADITLTEMANITHTSDRTLRRYKPGDKLSQEQSERMIEIAKLYSRGEEVFGSIEQFRDWMSTTLLPLGNKRPKEYLDTSMGINILMEELGKIEHGIFA